jgi:thiosulfate/3-mercaptopyruvate sulfurtransferase
LTEQEIQDKGYANPDALVSTQWVADRLDDTDDIRIVESDEDVLLYDIGHVSTTPSYATTWTRRTSRT